MAEVIISGPEGRIEAKYIQGEDPNAPTALILHPHPLHGGTMNNKVVYNLYSCFAKRGFSVLRFNFRGVGKSSGSFDNGVGELIDSAVILDWLQLHNPTSSSFWVAGFSFGSWIALQLLMRRPEIQGFIAVSPPANKYDFSFLSPCPSSGLIIQGDSDSVVPEESVSKMLSKVIKQKGVEIDYHIINNADHFYRNTMPEFVEVVGDYIDRRSNDDSLLQSMRKIDRRRRRQTLEE